MAFEQDIRPVSAPNVPGVKAGDVSSASRINALESAIGTVGGTVSNLFADHKKAESDRVVADSIVGLMNLQDEQASLLDRENTLQNQIANLHSDGEFSEEDRLALDELQGEIDFLTQARQSGVLSRQGFSTRFNALMRSNLARAENLGIQSEIASLFMQNRTQVLAQPTMSPEQQAAVAHMDKTRPNGWTQADLGEFIGKQQYAVAVVNDINSTEADMAIGFDNILDEQLMALSASTSSGGSLITDAERLAMGDSVMAAAQAYKARIRARVDMLKQIGKYDAKAQAAVIAANEAIDKRVKYYSNDIWEQDLLKTRGLNEALQRTNETRSLIVEARKPSSFVALEKLMGGGSGSSSGLQGSAVFDLMSRPGQVWDLLAQNSPMGESGEQMRQRLLGTVVQAMETDVSLESLAENGVIPNDLVQLVNAQTLRKPTKDPAQLEQKMDVLQNTFNVNSADAASSADNVLAFGKSLSQLTAETKRSPAMLGQVRDKLRRHALEIQRLAEQAGVEGVVANPDGTLSAPTLTTAPQTGITGTVGQDVKEFRALQRLRTYVTNYDRTYQEARRLGLVEIADVQDMFNPVDASTGETEEQPLPEEVEETLEVGESDVSILVGQDAVAAVEAAEGPLTPAQKRVVELEGFSTREYKDTKGISTSGVGQTGEFQGQSFKETFEAIKLDTERMISNFDQLPGPLQTELLQAAYRGDLQGSPATRRLINEGKFQEAAEEFLDNAEYRNPSTPEGIKRRMEDVAAALVRAGTGRG